MDGASLLIEQIDYLLPMDERQSILRGGWVWIENGLVRETGTGAVSGEVPELIPRLSGRGRIALPGLINTHHHFYQNMARAYTPGNNLPLLPWLTVLNRLWETFREDDLALCTQLGLLELMLSGATTCADHHYLFPEGAEKLIDAQFEAAAQLGIRLHASRGSMDMPSNLVADWALQAIDPIIEDTQRLIEAFHDPSPQSMRQVIVAPCAATSCSKDLLRQSALLAHSHGVGLHTHCGETVAETEYSLATYGKRPLEYLFECGGDYERAWLAHGIHFDDTELAKLALAGIGVAHCPNANMRLGSGICRTRDLRRHGVKVGIAVDGSGSNDSGHILAELRQALYLARVRDGPEAMSVLDALEMGTWRAAQVIGRPGLGRLLPRYCGDLALFPVDDLYASGCENPPDSLLLCHPRTVGELVVGGRILVRNGHPIGIDTGALIARHTTRARELRAGAGLS